MFFIYLILLGLLTSTTIKYLASSLWNHVNEQQTVHSSTVNNHTYNYYLQNDQNLLSDEEIESLIEVCEPKRSIEAIDRLEV